MAISHVDPIEMFGSEGRLLCPAQKPSTQSSSTAVPTDGSTPRCPIELWPHLLVFPRSKPRDQTQRPAGVDFGDSGTVSGLFEKSRCTTASQSPGRTGGHASCADCIVSYASGGFVRVADFRGCLTDRLTRVHFARSRGSIGCQLPRSRNGYRQATLRFGCANLRHSRGISSL